jgi:putative selenium metabolism protein SsnA
LIIRNARIVTFDGGNRVLDCGAVEVRANGSIGWVGDDRGIPQRCTGDRIIDVHGKLLMPALINCHTHLYSSLARGIRLRGSAPRNFTEILRKLWWKLDMALEEEDVYLSALIGLIDSAKAGAATLFDHHSSPNACTGSLDVIAHAFREVGLRGALCYETSDRNGLASTLEGIAENLRFNERVQEENGDDTIKGAFGLHASFTLSDNTARHCVEVSRTLGTGFHVHVAEDVSDVAHSNKHYGKSPVRRLADLGILDEHTVAAHCVHVSPSDMAVLSRKGVNVVHNPQSNCNNAVGTADLAELTRRSVRVGLGSDGYSPRMWDEFAFAVHMQKVRSHDPRTGYLEAFQSLLNNREIAHSVFGWDIGKIETGARADLMLVDYRPPTPINSDNLCGHILFGIAHTAVDSLWVNGRPVVQGGRCTTVDETAISERAMARARKLWARM